MSVTKELRRGPAQGMATLFISVDGSGVKVTVPTAIDRELGSPATITVTFTRDLPEILEPLTDAEVAEEAADAVIEGEGEDQAAAEEE